MDGRVHVRKADDAPRDCPADASVPAGSFIVALLGTVFGQLNVYTAMTATINPIGTDAFVLWVVVIENVLAAALLLHMMLRRRSA